MVLLGDGAVGKTAIRERYLGKGFKGKYNMTLGADFALKRVELNDTLYVTQIWDLAGQVGFAKARKMYYGGAMAGLLVFDINRPETFNKLDVWLNEVQDNIGKLIPLALIGNKSDLREESQDQITIEDAVEYAKQLSKLIGYKVPYLETSALDGKNIDLAFETIITHVSKIIDGELSKGEFDEDDIYKGDDYTLEMETCDQFAEEPAEEGRDITQETIETKSEQVNINLNRPPSVADTKMVDVAKRDKIINNELIDIEDNSQAEKNMLKEHYTRNLFPVKYKKRNSKRFQNRKRDKKSDKGKNSI